MDTPIIQFTPALVPIIGAVVIMTLLIAYAWRRGQSAPGSGSFLSLLILSAWWCATYALELLTVDQTVMFLWVKLQWISIALLPVAWFIFALYYAGHAHRVKLWLIALLCILPAAIIVLAWTTPSHTLLYIDPGVRDAGEIIVFDATRGPAFYVNVIYSYALILIATALIIRAWWQSKGAQRRLSLVVMGGALLPLFANAIYQYSLLADLPLNVDITVPTFALSAVLFAWGWFRLRLSEILPELAEPVASAADQEPYVVAQKTQERSLNLVSVGLSLLFFLALVPILTLLLRGEPSVRPLAVAYIALYLIVLGITLWRDGPYSLRAAVLTGIYLGLSLLDLRVSGLTPVIGLFMVTFLAFAAVFLPPRGTFVMVALGIVGFGAVPPAINPPFQQDIYSLAYLLLSIAMTAGMLMIALISTRRDIRALLRISRVLSQQLESERELLESRVTERTRALETSATVSRQLSTILDQSRLVREVVAQLRDAFNYYHVHIFLWDEAAGLLRMVGGTGEAGQAMQVMGHSFTPDKGLVGRAFSSNQTILAPDVKLEPGWEPNPLLPDTRAEVAVPIIYGDEVLGVLDAQDSEAGGLGPEDAQLLQTIAGQMAVALRNARLISQIQQEAEQAALINTISRKITQTTDIDTAMSVALTELSRALETRKAAIHLHSEEGNGHGL